MINHRREPNDKNQRWKPKNSIIAKISQEQPKFQDDTCKNENDSHKCRLKIHFSSQMKKKYMI